MTKQNHRTRGILALIVLSFIFAFYAVIARYLSSGFTIAQQFYLRLSLAFVLSFLFFRSYSVFKKINLIPLKDWLIVFFRSFSYYLLGSMFYVLAVLNTKIGNVAVIGSIPLVAVFGFMLGEKFTWKKGFFVLLAFLGAAVMSIVHLRDIFIWGQGEIFTLISVVFFSLSYVARKWQSPALNNKEITSLMFFFATCLFFISSLFLKESVPTNLSNITFLLALLAGAAFNVLGMFLTNYGFQHVDDVLASNILTLEAVFGIILGFLLYREIPTIREVVGSIVIVGSVIALNNIEAKARN